MPDEGRETGQTFSVKLTSDWIERADTLVQRLRERLIQTDSGQLFKEAGRAEMIKAAIIALEHKYNSEEETKQAVRE